MKFPPWMRLFHQRWYAARGKGVRRYQRAFRCGWDDLLDDASIHRASDREQAGREAKEREKEGLLCLHRHRHRKYLIEAISLPLEKEDDWCEMMGLRLGVDLAADVRPLVEAWLGRGNASYPLEWRFLCEQWLESLAEAKTVSGLDWSLAQQVDDWFAAVHWLTTRDQSMELLIRQASVELGHDSKWLEGQRSRVEKMLSVMMNSPCSLEQWGVMPQEYLLEMSGPLCFHFADGGKADVESLQAVVAVSSADLRRAEKITTSALRILTVENCKTTFRQLALANVDRATLLIASSYPTRALCDLVTKISPSIPWHHFGDTDPSGWHILASMRKKSGRDVKAFMMTWRSRVRSAPLSIRDQNLLEHMLHDPIMSDVYAAMRSMLHSGEKGDYEQESLGPPNIDGWPFYSDAKTRFLPEEESGQ